MELSMPGPFLVTCGRFSLWKLPFSPSSLRILRMCLRMNLEKFILLAFEGNLFSLNNFALQMCWEGLFHYFLAIPSPLLSLLRSPTVGHQRTEILPLFSHFLSLPSYSFVFCFTLRHLLDSVLQCCYAFKELSACFNVWQPFPPLVVAPTSTVIHSVNVTSSWISWHIS